MEAHRPTRLPGRALALVVANATRMGLQLLLIPILARVIAPEAFGLVDLAAPIVVFISILAEAGLVTGLVRMRASLAAEQAAFWFSAAMGSACVAAAALLASPVGRAAHQPGLAPVLWTLSPALLLTCLSIVPSARLQRTGAFGAFAASELFACIAGAGVALWTAMHGWGAQSLVAQQLTQSAVRLGAYMRLSRFRPRLTFDYGALAPVLTQSAPLLGANLLTYLSRSLDNILIGFFIGPRALGFYARAYQTIQVPEFALGASVRTAAMPAIAHAFDRDAATAVYMRGLRTISLAATPLVIIASLKAEVLVRLALGPAWAPAAQLAAILAPLGLLHACYQLNTAALIGSGAGRTQFRVSALIAGLGLLGIIVGLPWGARGVAAGYAAGTLIAAGPSFLYVLRALGARPSRLISGVGRAGLAGLAMIGALLLEGWLAPARSPFWDLLQAALTGLLAYGLALLVLELIRPAYLVHRPHRLALA